MNGTTILHTNPHSEVFFALYTISYSNACIAFLIFLLYSSIVSFDTDTIIFSNVAIDSGNVSLEFHSAKILLTGKMANIITIPNNDHRGALLKPNDFTGFSFTIQAYNIGGTTKINNWLLIIPIAIVLLALIVLIVLIIHLRRSRRLKKRYKMKRKKYTYQG